MSVPLSSLECELLEAIARGETDGAMGVLADYWIERVDEARGAFVNLHCGELEDRIDLADEESRLAEHAARWRAPALAAGYSERDLILQNGFLQFPIVVAAEDPLDGHPDIVRISPRYYRERRCVREGMDCNVYEAEAVTPRTTTRVALKTAIHPNALALVERECAILRRITHPNVARVLGHAVRREGRAVVFPWYGTDLRTLVESAAEHRRVLGVALAISVGVQLLDAIAAVHRAGIIHTEVRSEHVMVAGDGTVTLVDFGFVRGEPPRPEDSSFYDLISPVRNPKEQRYRFRYLSPEQCRGLELGPATDVFSAAGVICELATSQHLTHTAHTAYQVLDQITHRQLEPPVQFPAPLGEALRMALDLDCDLRPSADVFRDTLIEHARRADVNIGPHVIAQRLVELGVPV